ncbi:hypothetical protein Tco_1367588 [Tanacetum coccineum]
MLPPPEKFSGGFFDRNIKRFSSPDLPDPHHHAPPLATTVVTSIPPPSSTPSSSSQPTPPSTAAIPQTHATIPITETTTPTPRHHLHTVVLIIPTPPLSQRHLHHHDHPIPATTSTQSTRPKTPQKWCLVGSISPQPHLKVSGLWLTFDAKPIIGKPKSFNLSSRYKPVKSKLHLLGRAVPSPCAVNLLFCILLVLYNIKQQSWVEEQAGFTQSSRLPYPRDLCFPEVIHQFPYLKKDEYEVWAMKMEYWIINNDMNIWKVIQNGNSLKRTGRDYDGRVIILPPTTADEHIAVQRESKARTTLL